jgi:hypothetical protein
MVTKVCTHCGIDKKFSEFHKNHQGKFGLQPTCKECVKLYMKNNPHIGKRAVNKYHASHKKEIRNYQLKLRFGITLEQYNNMLEVQNSVCAICGNPELIINKKTQQPDSLSVDHNHKTGKVRKLLCHSCNAGLGHFKDNITNLNEAINYLNLFKE